MERNFSSKFTEPLLTPKNISVGYMAPFYCALRENEKDALGGKKRYSVPLTEDNGIDY